jgi:hypothetical protein
VNVQVPPLGTAPPIVTVAVCDVDDASAAAGTNVTVRVDVEYVEVPATVPLGPMSVKEGVPDAPSPDITADTEVEVGTSSLPGAGTLDTTATDAGDAVTNVTSTK